MNKIINLVLFITGVVLLFAPQYILSKDTENSNLKMIYEYRQILGVGCIGLAYYFYTLETDDDLYTIDKLETIDSSRSGSYRLPSVEKNTD